MEGEIHARMRAAAIKHYNFQTHDIIELTNTFQVRGTSIKYYCEETDNMVEAPCPHPQYGCHYDIIVTSKYRMRNAIKIVGPLPYEVEIPKESIQVAKHVFCEEYISSETKYIKI